MFCIYLFSDISNSYSVMLLVCVCQNIPKLSLLAKKIHTYLEGIPMKKKQIINLFFFPTGLLKFEKYIENVIPLFFMKTQYANAPHTRMKSQKIRSKFEKIKFTLLMDRVIPKMFTS